MIEIKGLSKSFGPKKVLEGVELDIPNGETMCVIGKSGSGKSVLLKHIVGLLYPDQGTVYVDGREIPAMDSKELFSLRQKIGFVFQGAALFDSYTVFENIILGLYEHGVRDMEKLNEEAVRVLSAVAMLPERDGTNENEFQKEWDILKNKMPSDLSGGMKKRVGVARALVGEPDYIFYDEPTTGLDPVTSEQVDELIDNLNEKFSVTSIVITHDMFSVQRVADKVAMLSEGKIAFLGTYDEMRQSTKKDVVDFLQRYMH